MYFIDSVWLADMLAHVITVPQRHSFVQNGILMETHLRFIFRGNRNYPEQYLPQYMQLLERFEIALSLGRGTLLIPSMLPEQRPALPFAMPLPSGISATSSDRMIRKSSLKQGCFPTQTEEVEIVEEDSDALTKVVNGKVVSCLLTKLIEF